MASSKLNDDIVMAWNLFSGFCSGYRAATMTMCERFQLTSAVGSVTILSSPGCFKYAGILSWAERLPPTKSYQLLAGPSILFRRY